MSAISFLVVFLSQRSLSWTEETRGFVCLRRGVENFFGDTMYAPFS